jgi:quercetin dioxygenase-like cupin family protein
MRRWCMAGLFAVVGCAVPSARPPGLMIGALRHGLAPYLAAHPLPSSAEIRADLIERTSGASLHTVKVRGRERPHRHLEHDLVVYVLPGEGVLTVEEARIPLGAGDAVAVERGATHWFASAAGTMAVALITFAPPLDAPDFVPAGDVDSGDMGR